jgi:energy-coupling factor transporter transmembrane protein EcfT
VPHLRPRVVLVALAIFALIVSSSARGWSYLLLFWVIVLGTVLDLILRRVWRPLRDGVNEGSAEK